MCLLTLAGSIIVGGALDGTTSYASRRPRTLQFPLPDIHIQQISCGRSHLLALSTDGGIWSVRGSRSSEDPALIKFVTEGYALESHPNNEASAGIDMRKVVAGWSASGALVKGAGIFVWFDDLPNGEEFESSEEDPRWVRRVAVKEIPFFSWPTGSPSQEYAQDPVVDFAIGENFIVFVTSLGKVFVQNVTNIHNKDRLIAPMELLNFTSTPPINRVEGSFRKFAVFNENGLVHIMDATGLEHAFSLKLSSKIPHSSLPEMQTDAISPLKVPELHNHRIVDVAFGDWHCLALTDRGKVFSWGTESRSCGSLGLGPPDIAAKRGVNYQPNREGMLAVPQEVTFSFSPRTTDFSYKISAAGWHSCALVAQVEADSTLAIGEFQEAFDGACESTETHDHRANPPTPKNPHNPPPNLPKTERGHRGGISGMPSDARGMVGGLADGTMAKGGESLFGLKEGIIAKETKVLIGRAEEAFGQAEDAIERAEDTVVKESETFIERVEASIDQGQEAVFGAPSKRASTSALGTPQVVESQKWLWKKRAGSAGASKTSLAEQEPARE